MPDLAMAMAMAATADRMADMAVMAAMVAMVAMVAMAMVATAEDWDCPSLVVSWEVLYLVACCSEQPNQRRNTVEQFSRSH